MSDLVIRKNLSDRLIFVFGSNESGRHGAGAARHALDFCGAQMGKAFGLQGRSFAIPTKDASIRNTLPLEKIKEYVDEFLAFARLHRDMSFQITPIGCGLAGLKQEQIKPMFEGMPDNCFFSAEWFV